MRQRWLVILVIIFASTGCASGQPPASRIPHSETTVNYLASPLHPTPSSTKSIQIPEPTTSRAPTITKDLRPPVSSTLQASITPTPRIGLRSLADKKGFIIGAAVSPDLIRDPVYSRLLANEFNLLTPENVMKWEFIHPEKDVYNFTSGDDLVKFAQQNGMLVRGHVLVWDMQMPEWVTSAKHSRKQWKQVLREHIYTVVGHYRGQIYAWDIVNEAVNDDGTIRDTFWMRKIGPDHISLAFQWAHEADPGAKLFYNDNGGEGMNPKSQAIYSLVKGLQETGIPIDGVGLQMHTALEKAPSSEDLQANLKRLSELGLEIHITEMDVRIQTSTKPEKEKFAQQAEIYQMTMQTCLANPKCTAFIFWGLTDRFSWIPAWTGKPDAPLIFDSEGLPKPAYFAIRRVLTFP